MAPTLDYSDSCRLLLNALGFSEGVAEDYIIISIDTEHGGFLPKDHPCHDKLLEVGLCVLDTRDIREVDPGKNGADWLKSTRAKHYRMSDTKEIACDAKDKRGASLSAPEYFDFGSESTFVDRDELAAALEVDFRTVDAPKDGIVSSHESQSPKLRKVILVAHNWGAGDHKWLREMNFDVDNVETIEAIIDTQVVFGNLHELNPGLVTVMKAFNIQPLHMHNGANDAVYTLVVLLLDMIWKGAWKKTEARQWGLLNATYPLFRIDGEEAVQVMKGNELPGKEGESEHAWTEIAETAQKRNREHVTLRLRAA